MTASGLTPGAIVTAARSDLKRHLRNLDVRARQRTRGGRFEAYAFHRDHVRRARDARELLVMALTPSGRVLGEGSGKRMTRALYADADLVQAALALAVALDAVQPGDAE